MDPRTRVQDAVVRLVARSGVEGVSVRKVAAEAGVSAGLVQHHFATRAALLEAAMERATQTFQSRLAGSAAGRGTRRRLLALAEQLVPLDGERATEGRVWLAFVAFGAVDPSAAAVHARGWQQLEDAVAAELAAPRDTAPDRRVRDAAALLLAGLDGLAVAGVVEPARLPPARLRRLVRVLVDDAVDRTSGPPST